MTCARCDELDRLLMNERLAMNGMRGALDFLHAALDELGPKYFGVESWKYNRDYYLHELQRKDRP